MPCPSRPLHVSEASLIGGARPTTGATHQASGSFTRSARATRIRLPQSQPPSEALSPESQALTSCEETSRVRRFSLGYPCDSRAMVR